VTIPLHGRVPSEALQVLESERLHASEIQVRPPSLDDVYIQLTGAGFDEAA
jgi:hypothetical protein